MQHAPASQETPDDPSPGGSRATGPARAHLAHRLRAAFLELGYEQPTMDGLAKACGLTRRALYYHFSSKEEAFRFMIQARAEAAVAQAFAAGRALMAEGAGPAETFRTVIDRRYGDIRRELAASPHAREIDDHALRRARDILVEDAVGFQAQLADLIREMKRKGLLQLHATVSPTGLAQTLCEGARGVTHALPPFPMSQLSDHYRRIVAAILYGSAHTPGQ
jgi:AcrR family transcriptional regulator